MLGETLLFLIVQGDSLRVLLAISLCFSSVVDSARQLNGACGHRDHVAMNASGDELMHEAVNKRRPLSSSPICISLAVPDIAPIALHLLSPSPSSIMSQPAPAAPALLSHSQSFSGSNSQADLASTFVKRRFASSSTLELFAPASKSFQPLPYTPHSIFNTSNTQTRTFTTRHSRPHDALAPPGMDPLPTDPSVVFIHPPFTTFPNSEQHPDGLCYQILANNPEWFLDPNDFTHETNANPHAIPYPPILEPPRGWCPARKKDLKERGAEGWPEGEEPRLRCTFCRRTYAGVNAKSMWRRHVFEKHKIAMANRRDGTDKPRGRGTGSTL